MSPRPGIAVVTPVHDDARLLAEMLECLRAQTRPPDEIVLVDDGSRDRATLDLLSRQALPVRVLRQTQSGPGPARNAGVRATDRALIFPLDADDLLAPECLAHLEQALERAPEASFAHCQVENFGADAFVDAQPPFNPYLQLDENFMVVSALLRREVFEREGCWYPPLSGYEDWSFWLGVAERGLRGVLVEQPLFRYRRKRRAGLLYEADQRRQDLLPQLRALHPLLLADASRARLKKLHAPALELLWRGPQGQPGPHEALRTQTFTDWTITEGAPAQELAASPAELLRRGRGKFVLLLGDQAPSVLSRDPGLLDSIVRGLEREGTSAVQTEVASGLRLAAARDLTAREVSGTWDELVGRVARAQAAVPLPTSATVPASLGGLWKLGRKAAQQAVGADRIAALIQPLKTGLAERARRRERDEAWVRALRDPPLLSASRRRELELLDRVPARFPEARG